jgi:hypothetical protein
MDDRYEGVRMTTSNPRSDERNALLYLIGLGASLLGSNAMTLAAGIWVKTPRRLVLSPSAFTPPRYLARSGAGELTACPTARSWYTAI